MKAKHVLLMALAGAGTWGALLAPPATASATVTYTIPLVQTFSVAGTPVFTFVAPTAGQDFAPVNQTSTFAVTSNLGAGKGKITGALSSALPSGLSLTTTFAAPTTNTSGSSGGTSVSNVLMTTADQNLVTGINNGAFPNGNISYTMNAQVATASVVSGQTFTVTYTFLSA